MRDRNKTRSHSGNIRDLMRMIRENENIGHELNEKARLVTEGFERCLDREKSNAKKHKNEVKRLKGQICNLGASMAEKAVGSIAHMENLWEAQAEWSRTTFPNAQGTAEGALRHLAEEVQEALANPGNHEEHGDIAILAMEAARKDGMSFEEWVKAIFLKQLKNRSREWPKSDGDGSEPINHDRSRDGEYYVGSVQEYVNIEFVCPYCEKPLGGCKEGCEAIKNGSHPMYGQFPIQVRDAGDEATTKFLGILDDLRDDFEESNSERLREGY